MSNTNVTQKWSLDEAMSAIKTAFLLKAGPSEGLPKLRYTDLHKEIASWKQPRTLYPVMLSDALKALVDKGELTLEAKGKEKWYTLVIKEDPEGDKRFYADLDETIIHNSNQAGVIADFFECWSFHGIPDLVKHRLRPKLRAEAKKFRDRVDDLLADEYELQVKRILRKVKGRMSSKELRVAEEAFWDTYDMMFDTGLAMMAQELGVKALERYAPGYFQIIAAKVFGEWPDRPEGKITYLAEAYGVPRNELQKSIDHFEKTRQKVEQVLNKLPKGEVERTAERLGSLLYVVAFHVAVVR